MTSSKIKPFLPSPKTSKIFFPSRVWTFWSLATLAVILILPSRVDAWFNGLPWAGALETITLALVIPFLLLTGRKLLSRSFTALVLSLILVLKIILTMTAPQAGWGIRVYASPEALEKNLWERTYTSIWKPGFSDVLEGPLETKRDFPIEWMNRYNQTRRDNTWLALETSGFVQLPRKARFLVVTRGATNGYWEVSNESGVVNKLPLVRTMEEAASVDIQTLPQGLLKVSGHLLYQSGEWSLLPFIIWPDGRLEPACNQDLLWLSKKGLLTSALEAKIFWALARAVDWGLVLFFISWGAWAIRRYWQGKGSSFFLGLGALGIPLPWLIQKLSYPMINDPTWRIYLALSVSLLGFGLIAWSFFRFEFREPKRRELGILYLLIIGPGILTFFMIQWWPEIGRMTFFSLGDDWTTYQNMAREIVVGRDPWHRQNSVLAYQPLYRYVVGLLHLFFGQSPVAQYLLDVWAVLGASVIIITLSLRMGLNPPFALIASWLYLMPALGGAFRHHIGRGLQEHTAMLLVMLTAWVVSRNRVESLGGAIMAGFLAMIAFWLRMDHLGVLAGVGLLVITHPPGSFSEAWKGWFLKISSHPRWIAVFLGLLAVAFFSVPLRNWALGGQWVFTDRTNLNILWCNSWACAFGNFKKLLLAYDPHLPFTSRILSGMS
ncbi:MAG: hypothetical protein HY787_26420, partial [Deltaproteobacteria bacterium]|nr:hypothetical protein [Deltaproteobacteria bacterium]